MPDQPEPPPVPDAFRRNQPEPEKPRIDPFNDPFNPPEPPAPLPPPPSSAPEEENEEQPKSGLSEFDAPHAFASVLGSGFGRIAMIFLTCMLGFGITAACHRVSLIGDGWAANGISGFFGAIFSVPFSLFTAPGEWFSALGDGITDPVGVPYLLLFVGGLILAVRSEIHIVNLMIFYAILSAVHAAAYFKMKNPVSLVLWLAALAGLIWLYRWYWRQQIQIEEEPETDEE